MTFIWAIVTGFILAFIFKNGWFFLIGLFVGPMLYRVFNQIAPVKNNQQNPTLFLTIAFEVLGHLSKAKGQVTQTDIDIASQLMDRLQLDSEKRKLAQESFNLGKATNYPLQQRLNELYMQYRYRRNVLKTFCEQLIQAAISDGVLHKKEEQILYIVAQAFHIPRAQMVIYIQMMLASYQFQHGNHYQQNYSQYRQQDQYYQNSYQQQSSLGNINHAYQILGIDSTADNTAIKRAYRKLMNEHHPDKLISKGLPPEMLEAAKKRAQEIQAAYDLIKSHKGFK